MSTAASTRPFQPGDHACLVYSSRAQLVRVVSQFLAEGLARYEHCWYVGHPHDGVAIRSALKRRGVELDRQIWLQAIRFLQAGDVYVDRGEFHQERADRVFGDGVTQARIDGFRGLRVAADVSWTLAIEGGVEQLVAYEAHARAAFAASPLTGLCLYHRRRLPLHALNGALLTHPQTSAARGEVMTNPFYDRKVVALPSTHDRDIASRLQALTKLTRRSARRR
jgi:hypothetical protein